MLHVFALYMLVDLLLRQKDRAADQSFDLSNVCP